MANQPRRDGALTREAISFADRYVLLVEELLRRGVPEDIAREEARVTALQLVVGYTQYDLGIPSHCPACGTPL
jgi:hypothetical protein